MTKLTETEFLEKKRLITQMRDEEFATIDKEYHDATHDSRIELAKATQEHESIFLNKLSKINKKRDELADVIAVEKDAEIKKAKLIYSQSIAPHLKFRELDRMLATYKHACEFKEIYESFEEDL